MIATCNEIGLAAFNQSLHDLYQRGEISLERALDNAHSRTDHTLRIRLHANQRPRTAGPNMATG